MAGTATGPKPALGHLVAHRPARQPGNPEVGATMMAALGLTRDRLFTEARAEGRREPGDDQRGRRPGLCWPA
ncbi:MAG: hypothetical protein ACRD1K_18290 [Acidimicrobiales bacterium]